MGMPGRWSSLRMLVLILAGAVSGLAQPDVRVEPADTAGTKALKDQTAAAAIRNYVESWQTLSAALEQNRAGLLDQDFVGSARDQIGETVRQQALQGIRCRYQDRSHDIQVLFYSPEGLSLELADRVEYDVQLFDHDKSLVTQHMKAKYIVVMTPAETRWRVRVFQAERD
jgi:hypothetical protein